MAPFSPHNGVVKQVKLRLPDDLHARLVEAAQREDRSLNGQIVHLLRRSLDAGSPGGESASPAPLRGRPDSSPA
ncbi:toxin-antitoxin system HicB family antitoxin [Parafrankia sp. FMc2]|uniref:toxin-antitoxin system HicB family antitoxin n=1 Tax=Parafrankia sp. FMc2 TaxID=3233196 RepID=UPI0034D75D1E